MLVFGLFGFKNVVIGSGHSHRRLVMVARTLSSYMDVIRIAARLCNSRRQSGSDGGASGDRFGTRLLYMLGVTHVRFKFRL